MKLSVEWTAPGTDGAEAVLFRRVYEWEPMLSTDVGAVSVALVDVDVRLRPIARARGRVSVYDALPEALEAWRRRLTGD